MVDLTGGSAAADDEPPRTRGVSASSMRAFTCKDCQRDVENLQQQLSNPNRGVASEPQLKKLREQLEARTEQATYNENWARNLVERGGSRSDRCHEHRQRHKTFIQGLAVAYIDLQTVGEVDDRENPTGPLGGLGPLPTTHQVVPKTNYDLQHVRVGMTDAHVIMMIELLRKKQVLILKAGTGTGKSTFAPYRLMDPPPQSLDGVPGDAPFARLTELGPIVVTEPRVQAAVGVASFVGVMSGAGGIGPGYPVGYQVSGDRNHDDACQLVYVTDGTMINWLREGRLSRIGTIIVDEAHERSTNIDFIMGYLKKQLTRYPHLRVIITSATFNTDFYREYFGGDAVANVLEVPAEKNFGYGMPLFPNLDATEEGEDDVRQRWTDESLPLTDANPPDEVAFIRTHWPTRYAPPLSYPADVTRETDHGLVEDVWDTTRRLMRLRYDAKIPLDKWRQDMPAELARFIIQLAKGLDEQSIPGDILGFLPTRRTIEPVCEEIERTLGRAYTGHVFPLISSLPKDRQSSALARRRLGDPRKIVVSTNLAETSLTVEGVRFVVDSGIIAQSEWDPDLAQGGVPTKPHSQAGIKQRWGRVGRKAPGWVFPLYTKGQYLELAEDTPPGSTRENLESLVMTARMGGIDDVTGFDWPAAFQPITVELDKAAIDARTVFVREIQRADRALKAGGAVDDDGHPTSFGRELVGFRGLGSTASALAIMYADRLACVPEVATILALLEDTRLIGQRGLLLDDFDWPDEWRLEAAERHRGLASLCDDDAEIALIAAAAWERADPNAAPWEDSTRRQLWARTWWVNHTVLLEAARKRHNVLAFLSPAMKEDVKRFLEPALIARARGVLTRALAANLFTHDGEHQYRPSHLITGNPEQPPSEQTTSPPKAPSATVAPPVFVPEDDGLVIPQADRVVALRRREAKNDNRISSLVIAAPWALVDVDRSEATLGVNDAMRLLVAAAQAAPADPSKTIALQFLESWPVGQRVRATIDDFGDGLQRVKEVHASIPGLTRQLTREERGTGSRRSAKRSKRRLQFDDDDFMGTRDDGSGELILDDRRGADDEAAELAELEATDRAAAQNASCRQCFACLDGRPENCDTPHDASPLGKRHDPVASWLHSARGDIDVSTPRVNLTLDPNDPNDWFEVTGYTRDGQQYVINLSNDWRHGAPANAAQHPDLKAGDPVAVRIGRQLRHHGGALRAFNRTDGMGRFILSEATSRYPEVQEKRREIAVSLDRGNAQLLEALEEGAIVTATVVPARAEGTLTITLLELLHQHWSKSAAGRGVEYHVLDTTRRDAHAVAVYPAMIEHPPNENGYATARLLHQDPGVGVVHRFDFKVSPTAPGDEQHAESTPDTTPPPPLGPGEAVLLNLISDRASLDVTGRGADALRWIEKTSMKRLELSGLSAAASPSKPRHVGRKHADPNYVGTEPPSPVDFEEQDEAGVELAPPGAMLRARTDKPLPRSAALHLMQLSDEPNWLNAVWAFWARSHHLKVSERWPYLLGTTTTPVDIAATVTVITQSPMEQQRETNTRFADVHPIGSIIDGQVRSLRKDGVVVDVGDDVEGFVPLAEVSWATRITHADQVLAIGARVRVLITALPDPPDKPRLSIKALTPDPYAQNKSQQPVGSVVTATVVRVSATHINVQLAGGADGVVHVSQIAYVHIDDASTLYAPGDQISAKITSFNDERRQVELSLKAMLPKPYEKFKARNRSGDAVIARVSRVSATHVNVQLPEGADGVVHVSQIAHRRIDDASAVYKPGDQISAKITSFNDERSQVQLSIKELLPKPYNNFRQHNAIGDFVGARVTKIIPSRVFVELDDGVQGSIYVGQLAHHRVVDPNEIVRTGEELIVVIQGFDDGAERVLLSLKAAR